MIFKVAVTCVLFVLIMASCNEDKPKILNRDPNGTSELQLTMREMYDYFDEVKKQLSEGKSINDIKAFKHINTDTPTEKGKNSTEIYKAMASSYFTAVEYMNMEKNAEAFNQIVNTCMACHQQVCPGPMVKIKKLYTSR